MSRLVLIDGNAVLHRTYHALPPLTTSKGDPVNAVYGFVSVLFRVIQDFDPIYIATAFDRREKTFRQEVFFEYQAQRPKIQQDLAVQFEKAREVLKSLGILSYDKKGFEADDVIGTIAKLASQKSFIDEIIIVTGDRDILQLVGGKTYVYLMTKGVSEGKLFGEKEVIEKLGIPPGLIPDYKALVGDASDNYPGVVGIGPKTAVKLLRNFGTIEKIYRNLDKLDKKTAEKLTQNRDNVKLYKNLAQIVKDLDLDVDFESMKKWSLDSKSVHELFKELGFKTLLKRAKTIAKKIKSQNQLRLI